jgi:glycosyltransferase involved in cell wall biosynthesis
MRIVLVSSSDLHGGAARAAYRLHKSLIAENADSTLIVQNKLSDDFTVLGPSSRFKAILDSLRPALDHIIIKFIKSKVLFSSSYLPFSSIVKRINILAPDIVHLHWVAGGTIKIEELTKINAPIVWSCHDMWPFTGGCHYDNNCGAYNLKCGNCKILESTKENDLSRAVFKRKFKTYSKIENLTVIGSSRWITDCAKKSTLFKNRKIITIPNAFDTKIFKSIDKNIVKDLFNIPKNKKVILFSALNSLSDPRKGSKELFEAINLLNLEDTIFVIAGSSRPKETLKLKYPTYFISPLKDEVSLALMYNVADVMIVPSLQENLANSIIESLSCGVPVVAFNIGGNKDMIDHKISGYLVKPFDFKDMALGIEWILENKNYDELSLNAHQQVLNKFDSKIVSHQYLSLYKRIVEKIKT